MLSNKTATVWSWNSSLVRKSFGQRISLRVFAGLVLFVFNYNILVIHALLFVTVIKIISQFIPLWSWGELSQFRAQCKPVWSQWEKWHWVQTRTSLAQFLGGWKSTKLLPCTQCQTNSLRLGLESPAHHSLSSPVHFLQSVNAQLLKVQTHPQYPAP